MRTKPKGSVAASTCVGQTGRIATAPLLKRAQVQSRAARGRLVAKLLAGAWRIPAPLPLNEERLHGELGKRDKLEACPTPDELNEIAPLLLKSGAAGLAWRKIRNSDLRHASADGPLHTAYPLHSPQPPLHQH